MPTIDHNGSLHDDWGRFSNQNTDLCGLCYAQRQESYCAGALGAHRMTAATSGALHADACERAIHEHSADR